MKKSGLLLAAVGVLAVGLTLAASVALSNEERGASGKPSLTGPEPSARQPLAPGTRAPDFRLTATGEREIALADYAGKNLIIVFYPMDQTPGCTRQLCALRDAQAELKALNTEIIASNPASRESHEQFAEKEAYHFPILVDAHQAMAQDYRVISHTGLVERTVYIVDGNGVIRYAKRGMPPVSELIDAIRAF